MPPNNGKQAVAHLIKDRRPNPKPDTDIEKLMEKVDLTQEKVERLSESMAKLETSVETLTKSTSDMVEMFEAGRGAFKVLGWIGTGVKWAGGIAAATAAFWALITHGNIPPK